MSNLLSTRYQSDMALPPLTLVASDGQLLALDWSTQKTAQLLAKLTAQAQFVHVDELVTQSQARDKNAAVLLATMTQLTDYFAGRRQVFELPLDLSTGTPFQQTVWQALLAIPYGQTISYAQLAQRIGRPTACRAVANANGRNPISLIVPCHRVIASHGGLGGYTGGIAIKQQLLAFERGI